MFDKLRIYSDVIRSVLSNYKQYASLAWVQMIIIVGITLVLFFKLHVNPFAGNTNYETTLSTLISALVSVVVTTFSVLIVGIQLASQQFSPRLVRALFVKDKRTQFVFFSFIICILYCLTLLSLRLTELSAFVVVGILWGFFCIGILLPFFVFYIADNLNASSLSKAITDRTIDEIDSIFSKNIWQKGDESFPTYPKMNKKIWKTLVCQDFGYIESIDFQKLLKIKQSAQISHFHIEKLVGNFIQKGEIFAHFDTQNQHLDINSLEKEVISCVKVGKYRSFEQDFAYGVRQLVDMAIKAISPAVNDPTTAINCIDHLGTILLHFAQKPVKPVYFSSYQKEGLWIREVNFEMLLDLAFDQIYQWGRSDYVIVRHIINVLLDILQQAKNPYIVYVVLKQVEEQELFPLMKTPYESLKNSGNQLLFTKENYIRLNGTLKRFLETALQKLNTIQTDEPQLKAYFEEFKQNHS